MTSTFEEQVQLGLSDQGAQAFLEEPLETRWSTALSVRQRVSEIPEFLGLGQESLIHLAGGVWARLLEDVEARLNAWARKRSRDGAWRRCTAPGVERARGRLGRPPR